jgi:WD40 repeat protein
MQDIFISYAREDSIFVEKLHETLSMLNITIWMDVKNVPPTAKFMQELYHGIEEASNFLFIISPQSVISEMCNLEVSHAMTNNKRIIPVKYRNVEVKGLPPSPVKTLLETVTWLSIAKIESANIDFARLSKRLIKIVETDLDHIHKHTRFLERAKEWETHEYNQSYLLQGDDLEDATSWLRETLQKQPPPTELHHRYIHTSQTHQLEENNRWEELYRTADDNLRRAERTLAEFYKEQGRSELLNGSSMQAALYLSEAYKMGLDDPALKFLLARAMETVDAQLQTFKGHQDLVESSQFSPDGTRVVTSSRDTTARVWNVSNGECVAVLAGHKAPIRVATYSSDGRYIVTGGNDQMVNIWDVETCQLYCTLEGHNGIIGLAEFSADNRLLITANGDIYPEKDEPVDTSAKVWNVDTRELLFSLSDHTGAISSARFSPNGTTIATGSLDGSAKVWDSQTGSCLFTFLHFEDGDEDDDKDKGNWLLLAFSPDGALLVVGGGAKVTIWDVIGGKLLSAFQAHFSSINSISFSPDGSLIATSSLDKSATVWDAKTCKMISRLEGHKGSVTSTIFSPDGSSLLTTSMDTKAKLWEVKSGRLIQCLEGHRAEIVNAHFNFDGTRVVTASWDGTAKLWNSSNNRFKAFPDCNDSLVLAAFNPDGSRIVTANVDSSDPIAQVWDSSTYKCLFSLKGHLGLVEYARFSSDDKYIITTSADKTAKAWNAENGDLITTLTGHTDTVKFAAFSGDNQIVATASYDSTAKLWSIPTGDLLCTLRKHSQHDSELICVVFSPDSKVLVTAGDDGKADVWNVIDGELLFSLEHADGLHAVRFSGDGQYILTASADDTAKIWNSVDGRLIQTLKHSGNVFGIDITSDNQKVVTASSDKSAKIWDLATGRLVCSLDDHEGMVWDVQFSPDNRFVITVDTEGQAAKIWDATTGVLLSRLENPVGMTTSALFSPDSQRALTTQAKVIFNPNVHMIKKTYSTAGSTLVAWNLQLEIRDPYQISLLIQQRVPFSLEEGRLLPVFESQRAIDTGSKS